MDVGQKGTVIEGPREVGDLASPEVEEDGLGRNVCKGVTVAGRQSA